MVYDMPMYLAGQFPFVASLCQVTGRECTCFMFWRETVCAHYVAREPEERQFGAKSESKAPDPTGLGEQQKSGFLGHRGLDRYILKRKFDLNVLLITKAIFRINRPEI